MKTIEILSNEQKVQFTTKSVTIDGQEYLYSHITELRHSEAKRVYGFKCDGKVVLLPYEAKDEQVLKAIFSQVRQMHRKPAKAGEAKAESTARISDAASSASTGIAAASLRGDSSVAETPVKTPAAETPAAETPVAEEPVQTPVAEAPEKTPKEETPVAEVPAEAPAAEIAEDIPAEAPEAPAETETPEVDAPAAEVPAEEPADDAPAGTTPAEEAKPLTAKEKKRLEKEQRKADKEAARREKQAKKSGGPVAYEESAQPTDPAVKSGRFKKAIIIFIIILAVFALLAIAYYFLVGTASDPQIGPGSTDQTQYNDIDDMINDLEN